VIELEMIWAERLRFRLAEDMALKGIALIEDDAGADSVDAEADPAAEFVAAAMVETAALTQAVTQLRLALGVNEA
jgi:DNA recombination-dependent growth factor C